MATGSQRLADLHDNSAFIFKFQKTISTRSTTNKVSFWSISNVLHSSKSLIIHDYWVINWLTMARRLSKWLTTQRNLMTLAVQGVPKKTPLCVQGLLEALKSKLQMIVGWVLKNSGNFHSNEHRNFVILPKNVWDIKAQSWLPSP